jgi:hypothetical protein
MKWERFQSERPDPATLEEWARRDSNVGIATGAVSGLLVLDLDSEAAVADSVPLSSGKGQSAMPHARRQRKRRAEG